MKKVGVVVGNPSMSNAYEIFGLTPKFNIDLLDLEKRFRQGQQLVHPDRFVAKPAQERAAAAAQALKLTEAYNILRDPLKRAAEYLRAKGSSIPGENGQTVSHSTLLADVMQWREQLEDCSQASDLKALENEFLKRLDLIKLSFDNRDADQLAYLYLELVYVSKILEDISYHPLRKNYVR
ncbi:Fe-S protein assembly co-chaperone HscB [Candidatus Odyssella thessalonicensis]|uniref:Fe-S protein assembly co-chaperone HscB n=1 Tax=Candidatus Odyssella thessalonicensis TaxID=84647 RepID=UPI0002ED8510|nr:Fe-S protein assembly co-chaperone HscB [Candidatus Odyssella thessalonicensis]